MIITVGGIKGGTGKSTIATNLAVMRAAAGRDVLLIDTDEQRTATDFGNMRNEGDPQGQRPRLTLLRLSGPAVRTEGLKLKDKFDDIVIDTGGRGTPPASVQHWRSRTNSWYRSNHAPLTCGASRKP